MAQLGARLDTVVHSGLSGELPARLAYGFQQRLPVLSHGEGFWSAVPGGDRAVTTAPPRRPRTDGNPFDRAEYTRFLAQRDLIAGYQRQT